MVPYEIRDSATHGKGVFAVTFIPKGTKTWQLNTDDCNLDLVDAKAYDAMPLKARRRLLFNGYFSAERGEWIDPHDGDEMINHSPNPNVGTPDEAPVNDVMEYAWALRDIYPGEELLEDYRDFDEAEAVLADCFDNPDHNWALEAMKRDCPESYQFFCELVGRKLETPLPRELAEL